jgi:hypothetical protein
MVLDRPGTPLLMRERPIPDPASSGILVEIAARGDVELSRLKLAILLVGMNSSAGHHLRSRCR